MLPTAARLLPATARVCAYARHAPYLVSSTT